MIRSTQSGFSLLEALAASGLIALAAGAFLLAAGNTARFAAHQAGPTATAARDLAQQTLRTAQDAWKYGALSVPTGTARVALPGTLTSQLAAGAGGEAMLRITVTYTPDPDHSGDSGSVSISGTLAAQAPLPDSSVNAATPIPQPSGAP